MATKPEDINPFAQYVETPKEEPTSDINPFAKYQPYTVGTGLGDIAKMTGSGLVSSTAAAPLGIESAARNLPRQLLETQAIDVPEKVGAMTFAEQIAKGPTQLFTNLGKAFIKNATGESFEKQQERQKDAEMALDRVISKAPRIPGTEELAAWGKGKAEDLTKSVSEVGRARMADSQIEGNLVKAVQNKSLDALSFGKDPSVMGYALQGSQVLGSLAPIIATSLVTKGNTTAVGGLGFGMGAGEAVQNAEDHIKSLNDEQLAQASPYFKQMVAKGVDPVEARKVVTDKAAEYAAQLQGSVSAFGDVITGKLMTGKFDKLIDSTVKNRLGKIALGTTAGMTEEGTQEFLEGIASDLGINKTVVKEIGQDSFANFILGAMGGAGPGAYRGAVAKHVAEPPAVEAPPSGIVPSPEIPYPNAPAVPPSAAVPPATPAEPTLTPVNVPPVAPTGAVIEPEQLEQPEVVTPPAAAPVAPVAETTGLAPEIAKEVELLQRQYVELEKRKADPSNTPLEQEINTELQDEIKQKIQQLVTAPPVTPEVTPIAPEAEAPIISTPQAEEVLTPPAAEAPKATELTSSKEGFIADKSGEPITLYHTTRAVDENGNQIKELIPGGPEGTGSGKAIWFGVDPNKLQAAHNAPIGKEGSYTIPSHVKLENPLYIDDFNYQEMRDRWGPDLPFSISDERIEKLKAAGFDGIIYEDNGQIEEVVAFNKDQVTFKADVKKEEAKPTKEEQIAINKARQEEKKTAAEKPSKEDIIADGAKRYADAMIKNKVTDRDTPSTMGGRADAALTRVIDGIEERLKAIGVSNVRDERGEKEIDNVIYKEVIPQGRKIAIEQERKNKEKTVVEMPTPPELLDVNTGKPAVKVTQNKIFTEDAATKARNRLRSKLGQLNSGIDPEFLIDGITLSGYHIEKGARTFAAYAKAMIEDLGDKVKPYLKQWYNAVRDDPSAESLVDSMDSYEDVKKASLPDTTNDMMDLMDPEDKFDIAKLLATTMTGPNPNDYKSILDARAFISKLTGKKIEAGTAEAKEADEAIETAIVLAARDIIDLNRKNGNDFRTYDDLVALYERQPNLSVRTSTSIKEQAYSTPAPLAYVASRLAGITQNSSVYEPTAGNGMLLIASNPKNVIANELNASRYEMLERIMDGATINNENAVELDIAKDFDAIIANPPFGVVKNRAGETISYDVDGLKTNEIDHAIAFKALNNMKEDGRAVLIVGGVLGASEDSRREGYRSKSKRAFYQNLYNKYNVVDHFTASGDMYKKQGAAYPVDIIVIDGKGQSSRKLPAADLPKVISSYEQLKEKLNEPSRMESRPTGITRPDIGKGETRPSERGLLDTSAVVPSAATSEEGRKPTGGTTEGVSAAETGVRTEREPSRADTGRKEPTAENVSSVQQPRQEPVSSTSEGVGPRGAAVTGRGEPGGLGVSGSTANERVRPPVKEEETQYQITYAPKSKLPSVETLMPKGMADAIRRSLDKLEEKVGDIDAYVAKSLEMDLNTLGKYFSAEQADALALSIDNAERGKGFIIGDQTGIGKGRVVAGMIKYAIVNGKIPIFVTEKPNLYADMIRDLNEIGMSDYLDLESSKQRVLITNSSSKDKIPYTFLKDENGKKVEKEYLLQSPKKGKAMGNLLDSMVKDNDIGNYKVIFSTYDQMKTVKKGATTPRREFLRHFADNNYIILDESHNAGGSGTPDPKKENVAKFARGLVGSSYGSFFSSATYAKRPNVMDLYASTDMNLAVDNIADLAAAIQHGGVPMQQVVATMLAEAGQYIRREKSFEGITYETKEVPIDKNIAENMATTLRSVLTFSSSKEAVIDAMQKDEDESGGILVGRDLVKSDIEGDNFAATMHNLIGQMLLSLKADQAANYAIERLKKGEKVVLTVSNTMGSFLNDFAKDMGIKAGEPVDLSFKDLFLKYLNKQRIVKIKNEFGEPPEFIDGVKEVYLTDDMLGPKLTKLFNDIKDQIENANYGSSPVSPIDYMQSVIQKAGYKTAEITGRNLVIDYSTPALILDTRDSGIMERLKAIGEFNNSDLNVMTLNRAGSTGLSLHSSQNFKNQDKRHMIVVQADADIAIHMQMLGRVNRTGQVNKPAYTQLGGDIPAENRPMAVLAKKMASLNANTTAGQKSAVTAENVVDFVNEYGGQIAQEFLADNPWFNETIGNRIKVSEDATKGTEEDIRRLTGFIPVFPIKQQEEIYQDLLDRYSSLIESVNSMGVNKLEAKAMDLDAKEVSSKQITEDKGEDSPFAKPAFMEKLDVKRTVKPLTSKEVDELIVKNLDGRQPYEIARTLKSELRGKVAEYISSKKKEMLEKEADPIRINQFEKQTEVTESHVNAILDNYRIGESISITNPEGGITYGVITDIFQKGKSVNPAAASTWKMQIALANGDSKSLSLSFSQIGTLTGFRLTQEDVVDYINTQTGQAQRMRIKEIFDAGSEERREKRWMVTGNLLAGFTDYPGQIVFYRKNDGSIAQGIIMPRTFDFEKAEKEAPVKIKKSEDAIRFLKEVPYASVGTKDKVLRVAQRGGMYSFVVPRSKRVGGTFFSDDGLMKALGTQFTSRGSDMIANVYSDEKALAAFDYIINVRQEPIVAMGALKEAREMFQPPKVLEDLAVGSSPAFRKWFGNSKITNEDGTPKVLYHITPKDFDTFVPGGIPEKGRNLDSGRAIWMSPNKEKQPAYHNISSSQYDYREGVNVMPLYVKMERPLLIDDRTTADWAVAAFADGDNSFPLLMPDKWINAVKEAGYDGIIYLNPYSSLKKEPGKDEEYIVFDPNQVKSAIGNTGEYSVTSPVITEDIGGITNKQVETRRDEVRKEQIKRQAELSRGITKILKDVAKGNIGINMQRQLNQLIQDKEAIKSEIAKSKDPKVSAQWFRAKADAENAAGNLTDDTFAVVDALAKRFPKMLDGLRLSVRSTKGGATGNFNPLERLVTVFKSGSENQPRTMRHEISHAAEQMMTPEAQIAVVENWAQNLQKAIEKHTDLPHQNYFQAVLDYIERPTEANYRKATNLVPEYEMYQYINPSEYWAVNAEKLMKASLGSAWARFVKGIQKLWEAMKSVLGFTNKYAIHREFDRIMSGDQERITHKMLVEYVTDNANALRFLNNVEDFDKQFEQDGFANTPVKVSRHLKDRLLGGYREARHLYDRMTTNPMMTTQAMGGKLIRGITYVRNKNVWFGAGLERQELMDQKIAGLDGKLRDADGKAIASIAVTNALHAGHIGSEVIIRGSLGYNQQTQMFQAVNRDFSMANVLMFKHDLIERVGMQRATNMINKFFEAKRSKSILEDYDKRQKELLDLEYEYNKPNIKEDRVASLIDEILEAKKALKSIGIAKKKVNMTEEQIKFYGNLDKENPELRKMLDDWTKVNDNMIDMMLFSRIIGKKRAEQLKGIKDYVPWYRIQDDMQDVHEPSQMGGVRGLSNVGKLKLFKDTETDLDIDDIVDNMLHNVMMITRNSMRNYAANRVAQEYATRNKKGQIAVFPKEGPVEATGAVRTNILVNGRRIVIEIKDPLIAEAVVGMENIDMPAVKMLSALANGLRRGITLWPEFQLKQLFMDAPTAALVTGVKSPNKLWAGTFRGFIQALKSDDPIVDMLKSYGIGGYQSYTRTPEKEYKQKIGLIEKDKFDWLMSKLDHIGDASDYAQRVAIYNRVKAETGDEMLALMQANNVIDFLKRGSGRTAQFLTKTVSFMNAYAQQIDVLAMTLVGGRLTGKSRAAALAQLAKTGAMFGMYAMLYSWAVGGHDDYEELDDQTKLRNIYIPKALTKEIGMENGILLPMHTSASFFFKSIPELTYNIVTKEGTVNEMDATRIRKALATAAVDSLLGPNPVPTGIKPLAEIGLNHNFFTGGKITPQGLEGLDAALQYNASTSELGKIISALTGNPFNEKRVLNPIEADHLVRSLFGTSGAALQWGVNLFSGDRPTPRARDNPLFGSFIAADVGRAPEDLFYGLKEKVDSKYKSYMEYMNNGMFDEADKYFDKYEKEIVAHGYISSMDSSLREINSQIRSAGKAKFGMTPDERRAEITELQRLKNEMLDGIIEMRKETGL